MEIVCLAAGYNLKLAAVVSQGGLGPFCIATLVANVVRLWKFGQCTWTTHRKPPRDEHHGGTMGEKQRTLFFAESDQLVAENPTMMTLVGCGIMSCLPTMSCWIRVEVPLRRVNLGTPNRNFVTEFLLAQKNSSRFLQRCPRLEFCGYSCIRTKN